MNGFSTCPEVKDTFCARVHDIFPPQVFSFILAWSPWNWCLSSRVTPEFPVELSILSLDRRWIKALHQINSLILSSPDRPEGCVRPQGLHNLRLELGEDGPPIRPRAQWALLCQTWTSARVRAGLWGDNNFKWLSHCLIFLKSFNWAWLIIAGSNARG